jgi:hypothetical protein
MIECVRGKPRRWVVERTDSWHNRFRRLLIRWERLADNYLAMLQLACGIIAFQQAHGFRTCSKSKRIAMNYRVAAATRTRLGKHNRTCEPRRSAIS